MKSFENSYFDELHTYETLDVDDEYDEMTDEENSTDEEESPVQEESVDDYDENQSMDIRNNFTLEEMENIGFEKPNSWIILEDLENILKRTAQD